KLFSKRGFKFTENNAKQADIISGAAVLTNRNGTAPGQWITGSYDGNEKIIILLPGPPHELKPLFEEQCLELLREQLPPAFIAAGVLKVAMLGESHLDDRIAPIYRRSPNVQTTILAYAGEIEIHLRARADYLQMRNATVAVAESCTGGLIGERITSVSGSSRYFAGGAIVYSNELKNKF